MTITRTSALAGAAILAVGVVAVPTAAMADTLTEEASSSTTTSPATTPTAPSATSPSTPAELSPSPSTQTPATDGPEAVSPGEPLPDTEPILLPGSAPAPTSEQPSNSTTEPAPAPATEPKPADQLTTVLWQIVEGDWKKPQPFVAAVPGADLAAFDSAMKCGLEYQVDIYKGDASSLWADGVLTYSEDGAFLAYGVGYTPYKSVKMPDPQSADQHAPCYVPAQIQDFVTCDGAAFVLDNSASSRPVDYVINGVTYPVPAYSVVHTDADGTLIAPEADGYTITAGGQTWTFEAKTCEHPPTEEHPPTVPTPPVDVPEVPDVPEQPTEPAPPVTVPEAPVDTPSTSTPPLTLQPVELAVSPVPVKAVAHTANVEQADALAYTGSDLAAKLAAGLGLLTAGAAAIAVPRLRRRARH